LKGRKTFVDLLNGRAPYNPIHTQILQGTGPLVQKINYEEFENAITGIRIGKLWILII